MGHAEAALRRGGRKAAGEACRVREAAHRAGRLAGGTEPACRDRPRPARPPRRRAGGHGDGPCAHHVGGDPSRAGTGGHRASGGPGTVRPVRRGEPQGAAVARRTLNFVARAVATVVLAAGIALTVGPSAVASDGDPPPQATIDEVYRSLGVTAVATDYVVLVDTSASMAKNGRYSSVQAGLRAFFGGLRPDDHVTLITFDSVPNLVRNGPASTTMDAVDRMPSPKGEFTDIGAAIELAFDVLDGANTGSPGAIVLLT